MIYRFMLSVKYDYKSARNTKSRKLLGAYLAPF
jgi:hypothetical protein